MQTNSLHPIAEKQYLSSEIVETFHETSLLRQFHLSVYIRNLCTFAIAKNQEKWSKKTKLKSRLSHT